MRNLTIEPVTAQNFGELVPLIVQQADHHDCAYKGDNQKLFKELTKPDASARVFMARDMNLDQIVGYVLYNIIGNIAGKQLYIEDICVARDKRGHGIGDFLFDEAKRIACDQDLFGICWSVAENNDGALGFYEQKIRAKRKPILGYDISEMVANNDFNADDNKRVRVMNENDMPLLISLYTEGRIDLNTRQLEAIRQSSMNPPDMALIAENSEGVPEAIMLGCSNLSSFRTVYGYKLDIIDLVDPNTQTYESLLNGLSSYAKDNDHEGHAFIFIQEDSQTQMDFTRERAFKPLCMSDDPSSRLMMYGIGRDKMGYDLDAALTKLRGVYQANSLGK